LRDDHEKSVAPRSRLALRLAGMTMERIVPLEKKKHPQINLLKPETSVEGRPFGIFSGSE